MAKRMLIDANHPEETRVVVCSGTRLEDFDYETAARKQLKGNIYLAKNTRVEPSLQAAFVEYGGNRHGFLPFSEIHPDYYRIPIADRAALIAEESAVEEVAVGEATADPSSDGENGGGDAAVANGAASDAAPGTAAESDSDASANGNGRENADGESLEVVETEANVDTVGGDEIEDVQRKRAMLLRRYKIQEVIKRRQVILVQVTKEERGNKGAALTTYLSLAGRYCVLMPNTNKGGGISRKISSANDRRRLKQVLSELKIPDGVAVIVRTAGSERSKVEIRRDYEYLMRLWSEIRETTLNSTAPSLIYEEANLIKRSIRDLYNSEMEEIFVEGESGYKAAKAFMKSLMPSHARKVHLYKDETTPLFHRHQVESQLDAMHANTVQLRSGGYLVLNPTEALVAIDVNSGKATRERHIEETALKTNIEAAEEVGRQLRLRDLAGLIVIDFIDMEESRHNRDVERRLKEALRHDRARIQLGRISPFGLLEMSRQRLRPSLQESSTDLCPRCGGLGHVRTIESSALHAMRGIEEEGIRNRSSALRLSVADDVALYILNQKRYRLIEIENRYDLKVEITADNSLVPPEFGIERLSSTGVATKVAAAESVDERTDDEDDDRKRGRKRRPRRRQDEAPAEVAAEAESTPSETEDTVAEANGEPRKRRRRGKRGGRRRSKGQGGQSTDVVSEGTTAQGEGGDNNDAAAQPEAVEAATVESSAVETDGATEARESKPKQRRPSRRRQPSATVHSETAEGQAAVDATAQGEATAGEATSERDRAVETAESSGESLQGIAETTAEPAAAAAEGPANRAPRRSRSEAAKPRRRPARKKVEASEPDAAAPGETQATEPSTITSPVSTTPVVPAPVVPAPSVSAVSVSAPALSEPAATAEPRAAAPEATTAEPANRDESTPDSAPKRRGWWNRLG